MHKKLREIIQETKQSLLERKKESKKFYQAMLKQRYGKVAIIAEIKLASPSEGHLGDGRDIVKRVKEYENAGVDAISIVTEKRFFKGDPSMMGIIKRVTSLPVLQKDFVIDEYQIYEAKSLQADAILLIARILSEKDLISLVDLSGNLGIEPVVEINSSNDLKKALNTNTKIVAVNARDLDNFKVDVDRACQLLKQIPDQFIKLGFSGIRQKKDVEKYKKAGAKGVLIGTSLMKSNNIARFLQGVRL